MPEPTNCRVERVCGVRVHCWPHWAVLEEMDRNIHGARTPSAISITNTESMYYAVRVSSHFECIENSRFSLCDGMGVVIGARFQGKRVWRFNGPILMLKACEYGVSRGWRHFFCGGREGVAKTLSERLTAQFPEMITAGIYVPPFRQLAPEEEEHMVATINAARPDVLWVGLGLLKQEAWIARHIHRLQVPWLAGVGAAFDYHAGTARWAPAWIRRIGLEWLYRLCFEPRMFKRNVRSYVFMFEALAEGLIGQVPWRKGRNLNPQAPEQETQRWTLSTRHVPHSTAHTTHDQQTTDNAQQATAH